MFVKKNVDSVIAALTKTVSELKTIADDKAKEKVKLDDEVKALNVKIEEADKEASRATAIASKIDALLTP